MDEKKDEYKELQKKLRAVLSSMKPLEQDVLTMRFGLKEKYSATLETVGKQFNISKADIRKIELKAILNMKREKRSLEAAEKVYKEEKYEEAFALYEKLAEHGNPSAQKALGTMYAKGESVEQDYSKAFELYEKAAEQGMAEAQYNLGYMYDNGFGVEKDYGKAFEWYQKAAEQGHSDALYNLGCMYDKGLGVEQDYEKAFEWYQKAADQGYAIAQLNLGVMY